MATLRAIPAVQFGDAATDAVSDEEIPVSMQTIGSDSTTAEEQALGRLTRRKLRTLSNWNQWKQAEHEQLNQFHEQNMFGDPFDPKTLDPNSIILRPTW